jgi:hypothetical protein
MAEGCFDLVSVLAFSPAAGVYTFGGRGMAETLANGECMRQQQSSMGFVSVLHQRNRPAIDETRGSVFC